MGWHARVSEAQTRSTGAQNQRQVRIAGLRAVDADAAIDDMLECLSKAVDRISAPKAMRLADDANKILREVLDICWTRMDDLN